MIGIDEVGRGTWAGPLLVAAVRLHGDIAGLTDSKLLSAKKRAILALQIQKTADIGLGWVSAETIDSLGLTRCLEIGALRAVSELRANSSEPIIIDGTQNFLPETYAVETHVKAELNFPSVAAASIIAKELRDSYMRAIATKHPEYAFESHVGYGTAVHAQALQQFGVIESLHRLSFKPIKALLLNAR